MSALDELKFNDQGLIPAIVQDRLTGEVRMMAWMNREALEQTLVTKKATFFSRSRACLWVKGEQSGHTLSVLDVLADCDRDTLLVLCDPLGPSCHTGQDNCFFESLSGASSEPARPLLGRLEHALEARKKSSAEKSYTRSLFDGGAPKIGAKITEEALELTEAVKTESDERVLNEAADLLYHTMVGLLHRGLSLRGVLGVLAARFGVGGHTEKSARAQ